MDGKTADAAEIRRLIEKIRENTAEDDGDAFGVLMERYFPLIEKTVGRFAEGFPSESDREDLRQEALMSLYRAAMSYDLSQGRVSFGLYARICMTNRMISCVRRMKRHEEEQVLPLGHEAEALAREGTAEDPAVSFSERERTENTDAVIRRVLSPFELTVWGHYVRGETAREIASALGKSEKSVSNAIGRIRGKLRAARAQFDL